MGSGESLNHVDRDTNAQRLSRLDAGHGLAGQESYKRTDPMGLLPCLRRGSDRWWLPCGLQATEALSELLLRRAPQQPLEDAVRRRVHRAVLADPPLMIFAALNSTGDQVTPLQLVDWLAEHAANRLASGDAYLGEPMIDSSISRRWNRLRDHFLALPFDKWLDDAALWLEVTGPSVPASWREQWPVLQPDAAPQFDASHASTSLDSIDLPSNGVDSTNDASQEHGDPLAGSGHVLQKLARLVQHHQSLESAFDKRLHKNKLGSLKQLAYGLSHEINNPLANISTRAQQLQRDEADPSRAAILQRIVDQVYRAHEMISDLMFYANPPVEQIAQVNPASMLLSVVESYRAEAERQAIRLDLTVPNRAYLLDADEQMIGEAVGSLIRNSIQAVGCQGSILVSMEGFEDRIEIKVSDSGPGLSEQAREHAFDPYFSGREAGRGLGLGLCRAYRIIKLHHGEISLSSGPAGCIASITLRIAEDSASPELATDE